MKDEEKELRKELGLPIKKPLRYMEKIDVGYKTRQVSEICVIERYKPSNTASLEITLENEEKIRILAPFFVSMQKKSFEKDMKEDLKRAGNFDAWE